MPPGSGVRPVLGDHAAARRLRACQDGLDRAELPDSKFAVRAVEHITALFGEAPRSYAWDTTGWWPARPFYFVIGRRDW